MSFDMDLMDCTVLACVLSAYCPFLVSQLTYILYHLYTVQYPILCYVMFFCVVYILLYTLMCTYGVVKPVHMFCVL